MTSDIVEESPMIKLVNAQDILAEAGKCVDCIYIAALDLDEYHKGTICAVSDAVHAKIEEADALLEEHKTAVRAASQEP